MKELCHFVWVSGQVILVEYKDGLRRSELVNARRVVEVIPGPAPQPD